MMNRKKKRLLGGGLFGLYSCDDDEEESRPGESIKGALNAHGGREPMSMMERPTPTAMQISKAQGPFSAHAGRRITIPHWRLVSLGSDALAALTGFIGGACLACRSQFFSSPCLPLFSIFSVSMLPVSFNHLFFVFYFSRLS